VQGYRYPNLYFLELLMSCVDEVLKQYPIQEKFLGVTVFAIIPSITEFMNAIAFACTCIRVFSLIKQIPNPVMLPIVNIVAQGNIALSLEIGSAYAVQVALIQIPSLIWFSFWDPYVHQNQVFTLIFPQWDVYSVFFAVFLLTYVYIEGKTNYFKVNSQFICFITLDDGFYCMQ
jgi:Ca2+:H+ antiporter